MSILTKPEKLFTFFFVLILIAELICSNVASLSQLHYITKPAIVTSLLLFFWAQSKPLSLSIRAMTSIALLFSVMGDILLMLVYRSEDYFMFGLISFLLAHTTYILVFAKHYRFKTKVLALVFSLIVFAYFIFGSFSNNLNDLYVPVLIYMMVLLLMVIMAALRQKSKVNRLSFTYVFIGALLFLTSDTILALNKFDQPISHSSWSIMLTYALAQYGIVMGMLKLSRTSR